MRITDALARSLVAASTLIPSYQEAQEPKPPTQTKESSSVKDENLSAFSVNERQVSQLWEREDSSPISRWVIRYSVQYNGDKPINADASQVSLKYDGWVSNSRCPSHRIARKSHAEFSLNEGNLLVATIINSTNEKQRCREKISIALAKGTEENALPSIAKTSFLPFTLKAGETFKVYLTLEHDHFLYGTYDPLLGEREVEITIAGNTFIDTIPLNQEVNPAKVIPKLSSPPKERLFDTDELEEYREKGLGGKKGKFLYIAADIPGFQYFRFDDLKIKAGDTFELSFDYCIFVGTEGTCHARVMEYQDTPNAWYRLEGGFDEMLGVETETKRTVVKKEVPEEAKKEAKVIEEIKEETIITKYNYGPWQKFKKKFRALDDTTTMAVDLRMVGANVGEMCIGNIKLINLSARDERP